MHIRAWLSAHWNQKSDATLFVEWTSHPVLGKEVTDCINLFFKTKQNKTQKTTPNPKLVL